jgi:hypothetical protein
MSDKSPSGSPGISRGAGVLISLFTAAIVFGGGMAILPRPQPPAPPPTVTAPPPPPPAAPPAEAAGGKGGSGGQGGQTDQAGEAAGGGQGGSADAATPPEFADEARPAPADGEAPAAAAPAENGDGGEDNIADCALPEKDMAREAWRRNWPTICAIADTGKGFILIPVKGPVQNAVVELKRKPVREARVNLPQAESQLTLKLYKLKKLGFKDLKVGPIDESAGTGTRLRVRLMPGAGDPVFDVKDGYAKITVATPDKADKADKADKD